MAGPAGGSRDLYLLGNCRSSGNTVCVQHPVGWRNRGSSRFSAALFLYCVNTKCGVEWKSRTGSALGWRWQSPWAPREWLHPLACRKPQQLCLAAQGPPRLLPGAPTALPSLSWHSSAALKPPMHRAIGKPHSPAPKAPLAQGEQVLPLPLFQGVLDLPKEQLENAQSKPVQEQCQQSLLVTRGKQPQAPTCSQGISVTASSNCCPDSQLPSHLPFFSTTRGKVSLKTKYCLSLLCFLVF